MSERVLAGAFFFAVIALPGCALAWRLSGPRVAGLVIVAAIALSFMQMALPVASPVVVGGSWSLPLAGGQVARHRLALPAAPRNGDPFVYVCTTDELQGDALT